MKVLVEWSQCNRISSTELKSYNSPDHLTRLYQSIKVSECFNEMTGEKGPLHAISC